MAGNFTGRPDHDTRSVVDEERGSDRCAGMDVDPRAAVSPFGNHPGNQRDLQAMQLMSQSIDRDRFEAGVAENDFIQSPGGGVAVVGRLNVRREDSSDCGKCRQEFNRLFLT